MNAKDLKSNVERELREKLLAHTSPYLLTGATEPSMFPLPLEDVNALVSALTPWILEMIDHALQRDRVDRGILPYDED